MENEVQDFDVFLTVVKEKVFLRPLDVNIFDINHVNRLSDLMSNIWGLVASNFGHHISLAGSHVFEHKAVLIYYCSVGVY